MVTEAWDWKGVAVDEKMDEPFLDRKPYMFFRSWMCRRIERHQNPMSKMRFLF